MVQDVKKTEPAIINLEDHEQKIFSQNGEDGILGKILATLGQGNPYYVEIGVEDGTECNTRYLREELDYQGLQFDKDHRNPDIHLYQETITAENINDIFNRYQVPCEFDLLSIDVDGNDFYLWLSLSDSYQPRVVVIEYNAYHPPDQDKIVEYSIQREWDKTIYFGASILALKRLGERKGYSLVYADSQGINLFFIRYDLLNHQEFTFKNIDNLEAIYRPPSYISLDENGKVYQGHLPDPLARSFVSSSDVFAGYELRQQLVDLSASLNGGAFIDLCYQQILQRDSTLQEQLFYLEKLQQGASILEILYGFVNSSEFQTKQQLPQTAKEEFAQGLYQVLLQRKPSTEERDNLIKSDLSPVQLLDVFVNSEEYQTLCCSQSVLKQPNLKGVLIRSTVIDVELLYPSFDQIQLRSNFSGEPFQFSDLISCFQFLKENNYLSEPSKNCFLDIGANIGSSSICAIKSGYFAEAIAIEASSENYNFLSLNIKLNDLQDKITAFSYGIADFEEEKNLVCNPKNCGDFRLEPSQISSEIVAKPLFEETKYTRELTQFTTLDKLWERGKLPLEKIGLVWIDCQGSEGLIFQGGKQFFTHLSVPLYVEFWPYGIERLQGKDLYFQFLANYAGQIFHLREKKFERLAFSDLEDYYQQNIATGNYCDILVMPL